LCLHLKRNYDSIAWFYDRLSRLVYGEALVRAQQYLIKAIPAGASILIVGGGTGWILEEITKIHSSGLRITYIDASAKMIVLARKRNAGANKVTFIASSIESVELEDTYDVVLTPFLFDNFSEDGMRKIFSHIHKSLADNGGWLFCDFQNTAVLWQKTMLKVMYFFFRVSCGITASRLPDTEKCFADHLYKIKEQQLFLKGFVVSRVYEKV